MENNLIICALGLDLNACKHESMGWCEYSGECEHQIIQGTAPNPEGRSSSSETTDKPDHEAQ